MAAADGVGVAIGGVGVLVLAERLAITTGEDAARFDGALEFGDNVQAVRSAAEAVGVPNAFNVGVARSFGVVAVLALLLAVCVVPRAELADGAARFGGEVFGA